MVDDAVAVVTDAVAVVELTVAVVADAGEVLCGTIISRFMSAFANTNVLSSSGRIAKIGVGLADATFVFASVQLSKSGSSQLAGGALIAGKINLELVLVLVKAITLKVSGVGVPAVLQSIDFAETEVSFSESVFASRSVAADPATVAG
jgi:hypothetical protein